MTRPDPRGRLSRLKPRRARGHRHLLTGSALLVAGAAIQAVSGSLFWLIAANLDKQVDVGTASKLFTSVLFVTYLAGLGLPVALARYATDRSRESDVIFSWGTLATIGAAVVLGLGYVAVLHDAATRVLTDWHPVLGPLLFAVAVAGSALTLIVDVRCMTMRRWNLVLGRIALVGILRLPLLLLFEDIQDRELWLFVIAVGPLAVSGLVGAALVPRVADGRFRLWPRPRTASAAVRYSMVNGLSPLADQAPSFALPVIVLANVSDSAYASFYVAWGIVSVVFYVPTAIGQAVLAEGGKDGAQVRAQVQLALVLAVGLMAVAWLATVVGRSLVTTVYGEDYADAARVLPAMMAAGIPWAITSLYLSEVRILHRNIATVVITAVLTAAIIVPALAVVPDDGIDGASRAWLLGNLVAAAVAVVARRVASRGRDGPTGEPSPGPLPGPAMAAAEVR